MSSGQSSVDAATIERTKQQIRGIVQEIAQLSRDNLSPEEYYGEVMHRIVTALAAIGGAVWTLTSDRSLRLEYQINLSRHLVDPESEDSRRHLRLLQSVMQGGEAKLVPPLSGAAGPDSPGNPTNSLLILAPLQSGESVEGVLEVFQRPDAQPASQQGFLRFLVQMADYVGDWMRARKLRHFTDRQSLWNQIDRFAKEVHSSLDLRETAYTVANEARRLVGCDRVTVAIARSGKQRIEAVSGQDTMDMRSNIITMLGRLTNAVCAAGEPLWHIGTSQDLPPQIEHALQDYVDEAHTKSIAILPLRRATPISAGMDELGAEDPPGADELKGEVIGALVFEYIDSIPNRDLITPRVELVCQHSARALNNSLEHNELFLMPLWRAIGQSRWVVQARTLPKTLAVAGLVLAAAVILAVWPADFEMEAKGELQPIVRQRVYFPEAGLIQEVLVDHAETVQKGAPVIELTNPELAQQISALTSSINEAQAALDSTERQLLSSTGRGARLTESERRQLAIQQSELRTKIEGLKDQLDKLRIKKENLTIYAPVTGTVVTWNLKDLLPPGRPIEAGQEAMQVVDPNDPWELIIYMPESKFGHVVRAQQDLKPDLPVRYVFEMNPQKSYDGTVKEVHRVAEAHEEHGVSVRMRVAIDRDDLPQQRPGAQVIAHVYCGRRPLGYVWFHTLWEWLQKHVFF